MTYDCCMAQPLIPADAEPPGKSFHLIPIADITIDQRAQTRKDGLDESTVSQYVLAKENGDELPPIVLCRGPDGTLWLASGFHRVAAYKRLGIQEVRAIIRSGDLFDASLENFRSNSSHGKPPTTKDRRAHLVRLLAHEEWSKRSNRVIATETGVSHTTVKNQREQIAKLAQCGLTVDNYADMQSAKTQARERGIDLDAIDVELPDTIGKDGKRYPHKSKRARRGSKTSFEDRVAIFGARPKWMTQEYEEQPLIASDDPHRGDTIAKMFSEAGALPDKLRHQYGTVKNMLADPTIAALSFDERDELVNALSRCADSYSAFGKEVERCAADSGYLRDETIDD